MSASKFYLKDNPGIDCLRLYTSDSPFASNMNYSLATRDYSPYEAYISTLLQQEKHLDPQIVDPLIVYTGIALPEEILESIYIVDEIYYWTTFITTTSQKEEAIRFLLQGVEEGIGVLFQITLSINSYNKYNLSKYSSLIESSSILLLPFFKFRVMERKLITDPHTDKKTAFIIMEEEREVLYGNIGEETGCTNKGEVYIIWGSPNIYEEEYEGEKARIEELVGVNNIKYCESMSNVRNLVANGGSYTYLVITDGFGDVKHLEELGKYSSVGYIFVYNTEDSFNSIPKHKVYSEDNQLDSLYQHLGEKLLELGKVRKGVPPVQVCQTCQIIFDQSRFSECSDCGTSMCFNCTKQIIGISHNYCSKCILVHKAKKEKELEKEEGGPKLFIQVIYIYIYNVYLDRENRRSQRSR